jgi:hypothetical protein
MRKIIFTLVVVYISSTILHAQEAVIKGRLLDTYSNEVITDVQIHILSSNFETKTNTEGLFALIGSDFPQGEQILVVNKLNYITQRIPITIQN